jgi:hypothetical protein
MSWIMVGVAGASALMSHQQAKEKQAQEKANMLANAEQIRYSPWTGMKTDIKGATAGSPMAAAAQGGLSGAMMGQQFSKGFGAKPAPAPTGADAPNGGYSAPTDGVAKDPYDEYLLKQKAADDQKSWWQKMSGR